MEQKEMVVELYNEYDKNREFASGSNGSRSIWTTNSSKHFTNKNEHVNFPYVKELDVDSDLETMLGVFNDYDVVQLRRYNGEKCLVLGCGNDPIFFGSCAIRKEYQDKIYKDQNIFWSAYRRKHKHEKCYTINTDLGMNPSLVCQFGIDNISFMPENAFDEIQFEGFLLNCYKNYNGEIITENKNTIKTLLYLLKEGGVIMKVNENGPIVIFIKKNNKLHHVIHEEIVLDNDDIDSYYLFWNSM